MDVSSGMEDAHAPGRRRGFAAATERSVNDPIPEGGPAKVSPAHVSRRHIRAENHPPGESCWSCPRMAQPMVRRSMNSAIQ
jgi:hypothetical protein